eukprot:gb/GECH01014105.1/.p1 GENE.gb/GECH01014105.1/~~gb/GECH01014105.1/.p1  ORF type:complete len:410 (+),score=124.90 gb/GECH01014105.1/:1-1230(+)
MLKPIYKSQTQSYDKLYKFNTGINASHKTWRPNSVKPLINFTQNRWEHTSKHVMQRSIDASQMKDLRQQFRKEIGEKYNERLRNQLVEYKKFSAKVAAYRAQKQKLKEKRQEKHRMWMRLLRAEYAKLKAIRKNNRQFIQNMWSEFLKENVSRMEQEDLSTGYIVAENLREGVQNAVTVPPEPYNIFGVAAHVFNREGVMNNDLTRGGEYHPGHWSTRTEVDPNSGRLLPFQEVLEDDSDEGYAAFGPKQPSDFALEQMRRKAYGDSVLKEQRKSDFERWGLKDELEELERKGPENIDTESLKRFGSLDNLQFQDLSQEDIEEQIDQLREWFSSSPLDPPHDIIPQQKEEEVDELFDTLRNFTIKETEDKVKSESSDDMADQIHEEEMQLKDFEDMLDNYDDDQTNFDL